MSVVILLGGFIYLLLGADLLVRGAVALARRARVPPIVVALTVVALGTSLPELVVSLQAAVIGYPGIALGNVVGSNIANVLLVGGVAGIIFPLAHPGGSIRRDTVMMMLATFLFVFFCLIEGVNRFAGIVFLVGLVAVMVPTVKGAMKAHYESEGRAPMERVLGLPSHRPVILIFLGFGLLTLPLGARMVVDAAVDIALALGMPEAVVGLSIIAFSTSLPELATTVVAARRQETQVAMGTLVGSNLFNILAITGVAASVAPSGIAVPRLFPYLDLPVMMTAAAFITFLAWTRRPLGRKAGIVLSSTYLAYILAVFVLS